MKGLENAGEQDISYEPVRDLRDADKKRVLKLAKRIEKGEGIAEKFRCRMFTMNYNKSILRTKITYRGEKFTLLHYAICHGNTQAIKDLLKEAKKRELLEEVLNEKMIMKNQYGRDVIYSIEKDEILKILKKGDINLVGVLCEIAGMEYQEGEVSTNLYQAAFFTQSRNIQTSVSNLEHKDTAIVVDAKEQEKVENIVTGAKTDTKLYENININNADLEMPQPICENSKKAQNTSTEQGPSVPESLSSAMKKKEVSFNQANKLNIIALHCAAKNGYLDTVKYLVDEKGVDFNQADQDGYTPLHLAAKNDQLDVVKYFIDEKGVDFNQADQNGYTSLNLAAKDGHLDTIKYLKSKGVDVENKNSTNKQAMRKAVTTGVICCGVVALTVAIGCCVANVGLSMLTIAGISLATALAVGLIVSGITYAVSKPSSTVTDLGTQQFDNTTVLSID
ncbi:ankyrin repeat domain-containing protein [Wolbachia endosymbiont of Ctenocephalides felis wCfeJ]|uniref:ankyrin repeat domain-containing protein n=1 Tax=Wolbachia endosymbiont of Ctenocephalides felis wCfeJ TaxID=2732594 RepID=UPI001445B6A6|nr:ankyrin repeat domain-containing protein [Wolbachia endosymbiont of Ctenocephalides felis wCfeJ]WCR58087.1 MAG: hypothetical protein PG980_000559 [Wolbachia endosymbiont of Ctenocephalides felis wCfeJ]